MAKTELPSEKRPGVSNDNRRTASSMTFVRRVMKIAVFLGIQAIVILALLEFIGRVADPLGISYYPETARFLDTMIKEEPIGYRNQPGLTGRFHGATYTINSLGLRDDEIPAKKDPDEFRILFLGDSVVFGVGVEDDESIPRVIERMGNERNPGGKKIRAINMGVLSYNTEQELEQLKTLGMRLQPDAVLLFYRHNDIEPKMWVFDKRSSRLSNLVQRSYAMSLLYVLRRQLTRAMGQRPQLIHDGNYRRGNIRWQSVDQSLTEINRICRDAEIPFLLFVNGRLNTPPYALVSEVAEREGFAIDTLNPRMDANLTDPDRQKFRNSPTDHHFNKDGNAACGTKVYELLVKHEIIPR